MAREIPVLLVDQADLCQSAEGVFLNTRYSLSCFSDVAAALASLPRSRFEIAVVDFRSTTPNGRLFIEVVIEQLPKARCIAMVERPDVASVQKAMKLGCRSYLAKPVSADAILRAVNDVAESSGVLSMNEGELRERLSRLLRMQRQRQEITLTELAQRIGLSKAQLSQIELGKSWPSFPTLKRISDELDQPFSQLFKEIEQAV